jgi:hypothetical protein
MKKDMLKIAITAIALFLLAGCDSYVYQHHHWRVNAATGADQPTLESETAALARDFGLRPYAARKIAKLAQGDPNAARRLELSDDDLGTLKRMEMPSNDTIHRVSARLGEDPEAIEKIARSFITDIGEKSPEKNSSN